jgi:hypothetical protein
MIVNKMEKRCNVTKLLSFLLYSPKLIMSSISEAYVYKHFSFHLTFEISAAIPSPSPDPV